MPITMYFNITSGYQQVAYVPANTVKNSSTIVYQSQYTPVYYAEDNGTGVGQSYRLQWSVNGKTVNYDDVIENIHSKRYYTMTLVEDANHVVEVIISATPCV